MEPAGNRDKIFSRRGSIAATRVSGRMQYALTIYTKRSNDWFSIKGSTLSRSGIGCEHLLRSNATTRTPTLSGWSQHDATSEASLAHSLTKRVLDRQYLNAE